MSKAILVVDVPDNLMFNELFVSGEIRYTINSEYKYQYFLKDIDNCSLKPIPKAINEEKALDITRVKDHTYLNGVVDSFSICLDEILGEEE